MQKLRMTVLTLFIALNIYSQNTTSKVPDKVRESLLKFHAELNEPENQFPLLKSDTLDILSFDQIKSSALEIEKELDLVYIQYYSENNLDWNKNDFANHFKVTSRIKEKSALDYYHINFEIDTAKNQSILNNLPVFKSGLNFLGAESHTEIEKRIISKNNESINRYGNLHVKIKYLTGYDTIKLSKNDIGKEFMIAEEKYRLDNILNGNIYIRALDSLNDLEKLNNSRYIAYKDQKIVHLPDQNNFPLSFKRSLQTLSVIINDSLVELPINIYENYLKNLKIDKKNVFVDLLILNTKVDFDNIYILLPKYDYIEKELKGRIEESNVDDLEVIRHSLPVNTNRIKNQPINN